MVVMYIERAGVPVELVSVAKYARGEATHDITTFTPGEPCPPPWRVVDATTIAWHGVSFTRQRRVGGGAMTDADIGTTATMMAEVFACVRQQRAEITRLRALIDYNRTTSMNGEEPFAGMQLVNGQWIHDETLGGKTDEEIVFETNADGSWKAMTPFALDALARVMFARAFVP